MLILFDHLIGLPWFYIWLGFLAAMAFVFHLLVKYDEWTDKKRVSDVNHMDVFVIECGGGGADCSGETGGTSSFGAFCSFCSHL